MKRKYAVFGKLKDYLYDIEAESESEALVKSKSIDHEAEQVILITVANDLGCNSPC